MLERIELPGRSDVGALRVRTVATTYAAKSVAAFDLDGREMLPSRLTSLLRERRAVAIAQGGGKLAPQYRAALRDDVPVLVLPPPEPAP